MSNATTQTAATYALFGATGKTGRILLQQLLLKDNINLRIYARSKEKLCRLCPGIESYPHVELCIGSIEDQEVIQKCLAGADTILSTLGTTGWGPTSVLRKASQTIIKALQAIRDQEGPRFQKPRVIWLSSSSLQPVFADARPHFFHWLVMQAFHFQYEDASAAQKLFRSMPELVSLVLVQPPLMANDKAVGYEMNTEKVDQIVTYGDLAAAYVELAASGPPEDRLDYVAVWSKRDIGSFGLIALSRLARGLFFRFVPGALWFEPKFSKYIESW